MDRNRARSGQRGNGLEILIRHVTGHSIRSEHEAVAEFAPEHADAFVAAEAGFRRPGLLRARAVERRLRGQDEELRSGVRKIGLSRAAAEQQSAESFRTGER